MRTLPVVTCQHRSEPFFFFFSLSQETELFDTSDNRGGISRLYWFTQRRSSVSPWNTLYSEVVSSSDVEEGRLILFIYFFNAKLYIDASSSDDRNNWGGGGGGVHFVLFWLASRIRWWVMYVFIFSYV